MLAYLIKRVCLAIPTILAISLVIFIILAIAPGDPLGEFAANPSITEEVRENIRKSFGLDQPLHIRYFKWIFAFLRGDFGYSFTSRSPVSELILQRLPTTLWIVGTAYFLSCLIAFPLGIISAIKRNQWIDQVLTTFSFLGFSLPTFFTGLLFILLFSIQLHWLPFIYNSTLELNRLSNMGEQIKQSIMPITVLVLYQMAVLMRFMRSSVIDELPQEYVKTAYAKGLNQGKIIRIHVLRNAMIPVITLVALDIPAIFTGALVTEQIFRVPGIGSLLIESIHRSDTPVVMAITVIYGVLIVIFNMIADVLYGFLDPRVRYEN